VFGGMGDVADTRKAIVGDFDDPAAVQQTVGALETSVELQRTLVNVLHALYTTAIQRYFDVFEFYNV